MAAYLIVDTLLDDADLYEQYKLKARPWIEKFGFPLLLLMVGCIGGSYATAADSPTSVVRMQRAESNAAIKAHDAHRLRKLFEDDYHGIAGTSGALDSGGDAAARSYADEEFKDPTFVTIDAHRRPSSTRHQASALQNQGIGKVSGESRMEPCKKQGCTSQCGFPLEALGA
jgi:uncharacterized protein (DUF1330 family)